MTVTEVKQALGSWELRLHDSTPRELLDKLTYFGHLVVAPGRLDVRQYGDALLTSARYVGVYRGRAAQNEFTLKGCGMAFWLGEGDDKGDLLEAPVTLTAQSFANSVRALLPPGGAVTEGTLFSVAGTYTDKHQWVTPRKAITYVTDTFQAEWRVNGNGTLDAGTVSQLYKTTPTTILMQKQAGADLQRKALPGRMSMDTDVEDYTTRVVLLAEGEGDSIATGSATAAVVPYKDIHGGVVKQTRLVSESETSATNAAARAQLALNAFAGKRNSVTLDTSSFDVKGDLVVGDYVDVYDPINGFTDPAREVYWDGRPINPMALRCVELTWPIAPGWTVAFRTTEGEWIDLSPYYAGETGNTTIVVGDLGRALSGLGNEDIGIRPNLPSGPGTDSTIPAAPVFTGFSTGVYESDDRTMAAVQLTWTQPLNGDGSTITDGDHYEIRYRPNAVIGAPVPWDYLSGGYAVDFTDDFNTPASGGFGTGWSSIGGTTEHSVAGGEAQIAHPTFGLIRGQQRTSPIYANVEVLTSNKISYAPAGASTVMGTFLRRVDANNLYWVRVEPNIDQTITVKITRYKAGVFTELAVWKIPGMVHTPDREIWLRSNLYGSALSAKVWQGTIDDEPIRDTLSVIDADVIAGAGTVGIMDYIVAGATNPTGSVTRHPYFRARSLAPDNVGSAYTWDGLGSWDAPSSEAVAITPNWSTAFVGWDSTTYMLTELAAGIQYEFQIRALDAASPPHFSPWSASLFNSTSGDVIPPSAPAPPIVARSMIAVQIEHRLGKATGGTFNLEIDLARLEIHASDTPTFFPDSSTKVGDLIATGTMVRSSIPAVGTFKVDQATSVWIRVVAVDRSGNASPPSDAVQSSVTLIDDAHISDLTVSKVTAGTITATWIMAGAIKTAETGARVVIDGTGIEAYNAAGGKTVDINSADGSATFTGILQTELNDAGVSFETAGGQVQGRWSVRQSGAVLDHYVREYAAPFSGLGGQGFETSIRRRSDDAQDGGKVLLSEGSVILSHQPDVGAEAFITLGDWPSGVPQAIYMRGKFARTYVADSNGAIFTVVESVPAGFGSLPVAYGPTMSEYMNVVASITGVITENCVLTGSTATGFTVAWQGSAAHVVYVWAVRVDAP